MTTIYKNISTCEMVAFCLNAKQKHLLYNTPCEIAISSEIAISHSSTSILMFIITATYILSSNDRINIAFGFFLSRAKNVIFYLNAKQALYFFFFFSKQLPLYKLSIAQ